VATAQIRIEGDASGALRSIQQIETALGRIQNVARNAQSALTGVVAAVAGGSLLSFVDELQNVQNKLKIASGSSEEFTKSMEMIRAIADKTGQSLAATGDLYARVAQNAQKLGYGQSEVVTVTNAMATALKVAGASSQGAASTLYQFGQILAKGKVNGDEFTTIMENLGSLMPLIAKNMGVTTEELLRLKEKGLIGAKDFTDALIRSMGDLDSMSGKTSQTIGQSLQRIQNAFGSAILEIDNATGFSQAFADVANKISSNGANLVPVLKALGAALLVIGVVVAPIPVIFAAVAAAALYFADVLGPILKPVIDIAEAAISALIRTLVGLGSALRAIVNAENPYKAYAKAVEDFDNKAKKATNTAVTGNKDLKAAADGAAASVGNQAGQLTGVADKYKLILRDLQEQLTLAGMSQQQLKVEQPLLQLKVQLERQTTTEQEKQLRGLLTRIEAEKARAGIAELLKATAAETNILYAQGSILQSQLSAVEQLRKQYGQDIADQYKVQVSESVRLQKLGAEEAKFTFEKLQAEKQLAIVLSEGKNVSAAQLDIMIKQNQVLASLQGDSEILKQAEVNRLLTIIEETEQLRLQADTYRQIVNSVTAINKPLKGRAAGAAAAGQLGQLDPITKALTDQQTINEGLRVLREQDLISEQQYLAAMTNANIQSQQQIYDAKLKQFENAKLLRIQETTGSQFGFETQKQMAAESARFEMKSTQEKVQFGIEQGANMFTALGKYNKDAFKAAQAFNIANAIMNTYMGATKALATYPPPFNFIAAAAVVAMGMAQVAQIRSQQYSGRQLGGPVMGGTSYIVGENGPEMFTPNTTGSITRNGDLGSGGAVNVNFTIVANDTTGFDELLSSRQNVIKQIISDAMLERGQRSMV
jgi:tape measure domain-containing protein